MVTGRNGWPVESLYPRDIFSTDGKRFYFTLEDRQSDLWFTELKQR